MFVPTIQLSWCHFQQTWLQANIRLNEEIISFQLKEQFKNVSFNLTHRWHPQSGCFVRKIVAIARTFSSGTLTNIHFNRIMKDVIKSCSDSKLLNTFEVNDEIQSLSTDRFKLAFIQNHTDSKHSYANAKAKKGLIFNLM